jgi:hypothetical protein
MVLLITNSPNLNKFADGTDVTQTEANDEQKAYAKQIAKFLARNILPLKAENADNRFILIGTDRHISSQEREARRGMMSQTLCLQLYDAKEKFYDLVEPIEDEQK